MATFSRTRNTRVIPFAEPDHWRGRLASTNIKAFRADDANRRVCGELSATKIEKILSDSSKTGLRTWTWLLWVILDE